MYIIGALVTGIIIVAIELQEKIDKVERRF